MADGQEYVQGGIFGGLKFQPLDWGAPTGSTPAAKSAPDTSAAQSTATGTAPKINWYDPSSWKLPSIQDVFTGMQNGAKGATTDAIKAATGLDGSKIDNYLQRGTIIFLGFIFVAAGLYMLKPTAVTQVIAKIKPA